MWCPRRTSVTCSPASASMPPSCSTRSIARCSPIAFALWESVRSRSCRRATSSRTTTSRARCPGRSLMLLGSGSQDDALRALATALGLRDVLFTGAVPPERIASYYTSADLYVQTPAVDNMPLSILEAFASGLPVVSTAVGGVPAIVKDGVDGLLAPDNDAEQIANRIVELIDRPDVARGLAATALAKCEQYDWRAARESWLAIYRTLARPNRKTEHPLPAQESA